MPEGAVSLRESATAYLQQARRLSAYWERPLGAVLARMAVGRLVYGRGPQEFDQYRFAVKPVREWRRYASERERVRLQMRAAPVSVRGLEEDKIAFWLRCRDAALPAIPIIAAVGTGVDERHAAPVPTARSGTELDRLMEPQGDSDGFAKPIRGGQGYGGFQFAVRERRFVFPGGAGSARDLFDYIERLRFSRHGYILQPRVRPHPGLTGLMPGPGLGTFRLTTFLGPDGAVEVPWAVMKVPAPGQVVCNPRLGSLMAAVDLGTGRLATAVGPTADVPVVHPVAVQPETGTRFDAVTVPQWDAVKALVVRAARAFPELPCLGWDVAVTPDGPVLIEANWEFGIYTQQIVYDRGMRADLADWYQRYTRP